MEYLSKLDGLLKKHGIKNLGACSVYTEHLTVLMAEAPSLEAFQKLNMEPELLALSAYETFEVKLAMGFEEGLKMLKAIKS